MKTPQNPYRCILGRVQPKVTDLDAIKRNGWQGQHILVIAEHDERIDVFEREIIRRIGDRLYGSRTSGGRHG
jgi:16S rRNA G966 N2-methylase RsmD